MWSRSDLEDCCESQKLGGAPPGWVPGHCIRDGRRQSMVSDSGDTGIGTYCSDSVEDDSSSSTTPLSFQPLSQHHLNLDDDGIPVVLPSPSSSPGSRLRIPVSPHSTGHWNRPFHLPIPATSPGEPPSVLDMKDHQPMRRSSSFTKLSSGADKNSKRTSVGRRYNPDTQGSLDRSLLKAYRKESLGSNTDLYLPLSSSLICSSLLQHSPGSRPAYRFHHSSRSSPLETDLLFSSVHSSPIKQKSLDMNFNSLPEAKLAHAAGHGHSLPTQVDSPVGQRADRGSPIQPAVRTQMWLTEQMEYRPPLEYGADPSPINSSGSDSCCVDGLSPWQQEPGLNQMLRGGSLPVSTLVKVKEGLLRQRELEINRQKQQILQLHSRIRENELRAQQVLQSQRGLLDDPFFRNTEESAARPPCAHTSDMLYCNEELGKKLVLAELEVFHLNKFFSQVTQRYTEDIRKLEEKIKTRDRYISSLKKKCQRESDQNQEKQQRIETLEKYLSDLPTLDEVQVQSKKEELQQKAKDLEETVSRLQKNLEEGSARIREKDFMIEVQANREKELIASVHSLQEKVQQCLDDGVRLPMQDLKRLEVENSQLLQQQDHSSRLFKHQKDEIERLTSQLMVTSTRLQKKSLPHQHPRLLEEEEEEGGLIPRSGAFLQVQDEDVLEHCLPPAAGTSEVDRLLKEMSLCLLDLQGLCSILAQRAQGKQPNLSLLLAMKSFSVPAEETRTAAVDEALSIKLLEVNQLRRDIDDLRRNISDRYSQGVDDSCITQ
ncbi:centrosomal protein of 85 kDa-like isoform X2 [Melanotaenia boesemani]|uniref:centrosomal protein of 85 kDa-like isoform X2 n=1 Tax=Melanotaenia boesemani TaxID=1250792 RepID=UPI001C04F697|nr:centrosomal protein of 85 kDa-like isoform X2 [Melanotaenia boesemani]